MLPKELVDERPHPPISNAVYRPKPIIRHVPLTNGILYGDNYRRSYCGGRVGVRGYNDRIATATISTSTSSQYDTETDFTGNECYCDECHRVRINGQRCHRSAGRRNRYSMPRLGYYGTINGGINGGINDGANGDSLRDQMGQLKLSGSSESPGQPSYLGQPVQSGSQRSTLRRRRKNRGCVHLIWKQN